MSRDKSDTLVKRGNSEGTIEKFDKEDDGDQSSGTEMGAQAEANFDGMSEVTSTMVKLESDTDFYSKSNVRHDDGTIMENVEQDSGTLKDKENAERGNTFMEKGNKNTPQIQSTADLGNDSDGDQMVKGDISDMPSEVQAPASTTNVVQKGATLIKFAEEN